MEAVAVIFGALLILIVLNDTFETIVVPKTVSRRFTPTSLYYESSWALWIRLVRRLREGPTRQWLLASYAPLTLPVLIVIWASLMVLGFGFVYFGLMPVEGQSLSLGETIYFSGVTFFTLGYGDIQMTTPALRTLAVIEVAVGFAFLGLVVAYVPVLYQAFSRREQLILLLDSKAGSNPSAGELLRRHLEVGAYDELVDLLKEWEKWSAQHLETYLSYPILAYYRSQHEGQSWLTALTCVMDACALIQATLDPQSPGQRRAIFQAQATFAMGRHLLVDIAYVLSVPPRENPPHRLTSADMAWILRLHSNLGMPLDSETEQRLRRRTDAYEPYLVGLAQEFFYVLPAWTPFEGALDNWEISAWDDALHFRERP